MNLFLKEVRFRFIVGVLFFMLGIITIRKEVEKPNSGQLTYRFGRILKCRLKPSVLVSAVRSREELDHRIVTTAAATYDGINVVLELK